MAEKVRIAVGSDHAGLPLKLQVREHLAQQGYEVEDVGTNSPESTDYPDYAEKVAERVAGGRADFGVLMCGTGIGVSISANKVPGIRAALCNDTISAYFARAHNNANVLAMGGRLVDVSRARKVLDTWFATPFEGGRHARRLEKISGIEKEFNRKKE